MIIQIRSRGPTSHYWVLVDDPPPAGSGKDLATSELFISKCNCRETAERLLFSPPTTIMDTVVPGDVLSPRPHVPIPGIAGEE